MKKTRVTNPQKVFNNSVLKRDNVNNAFCYEPLQDINGRRILIIDDIFDSGATIKEVGKRKTGDGALGVAAVKIAYSKVSLTFSQALWRGIGCNWLVCLAVWMALAARHTIGKIFAIFFPIMAFVALGFEHCIANMYFIPTGILFVQALPLPAISGVDLSAINWVNFLWKNLLPVTIGNIIGGSVFVGMSYWGAYIRPIKSSQSQ